MIEISAAREGFQDKVISDIGLDRSNNNLAYEFTKPMCQAAIRETLNTGSLSEVPVQWLI